jgi:hypothetical protein
MKFADRMIRRVAKEWRGCDKIFTTLNNIKDPKISFLQMARRNPFIRIDSLANRRPREHISDASGATVVFTRNHEKVESEGHKTHTFSH